MIPDEFVLVIEIRILVRDGDDATGVPDLLLADTHFVPGDPQERRRAGDGRVVVSVALRVLGVNDIGEISGHESAESVVVGELVRAEPLGEEVRFLLRRGWKSLLIAVAVPGDAVGRASVSALLVRPAVARHGLAVFEGEKGFFFGFERPGEICDERVDGGVERDMEEDDEDQEDDHEHYGPGSCGCAEETDQADSR